MPIGPLTAGARFPSVSPDAQFPSLSLNDRSARLIQAAAACAIFAMRWIGRILSRACYCIACGSSGSGSCLRLGPVPPVSHGKDCGPRSTSVLWAVDDFGLTCSSRAALAGLIEHVVLIYPSSGPSLCAPSIQAALVFCTQVMTLQLWVRLVAKDLRIAGLVSTP